MKDFTATSLVGPHATPAQVTNASLISCLYHCRYNLLFVQQEFPANIWQVLLPSIEAGLIPRAMSGESPLTQRQAFEKCYLSILDALDLVIKRDISSILARLHRVDFAKPMDPMSMGGGGSAYMEDLLDRLAFVKGEILGRMSLGEAMKEK